LVRNIDIEGIYAIGVFCCGHAIVSANYKRKQ